MTSNFIFYNPNPNQRFKKDNTPMKWHGTDCTVRSLAKAMNWSWLQAYDALVDEGRKMMMTYDDIAVLRKIYGKLGFVKGDSVKGQKPTIREFCRQHSKGTYIISISGHVVTCKDGIIYDTWDCSGYKVRSYYIKTK